MKKNGWQLPAWLRPRIALMCVIDRYVTRCSKKTRSCAGAWSCKQSSYRRCVLTSASFANTPSLLSLTRWTHFTCNATPRFDGSRPRLRACRSATAGPRRWPADTQISSSSSSSEPCAHRRCRFQYFVTPIIFWLTWRPAGLKGCKSARRTRKLRSVAEDTVRYIIARERIPSEWKKTLPFALIGVGLWLRSGFLFDKIFFRQKLVLGRFCSASDWPKPRWLIIRVTCVSGRPTHVVVAELTGNAAFQDLFRQSFQPSGARSADGLYSNNRF